MRKKVFFARHAKSSAAVVSLAIHATIILVAVFFVVFTAVQKDDQNFDAKQVYRPRQKLKKLQVPVNINKNTLKPKLRKRIVASNVQRGMPEIEMPEITGVMGGMGGAGEGGIGMTLRDGTGGISFTMPEIDFFGVKGKGEKIFLILDTNDQMLIDEMGGIPAYTIIKDEMIRIVEELPPTALFNVCIFQHGNVQTLFPVLVPATDLNAQKTKDWLLPLNSATDAAKSGNYGIKTLGAGGVNKTADYRIGKFAKPMKKGGEIYGDPWSYDRRWYDSVMVAMQQQADTVFVLSSGWGSQRVALEKVPTFHEWRANTSAGKRWAEYVAKGQAKLAAENEKRKAAGQAPKVIASGEGGIIGEYFPETERPPQPDFYYYKPREFAEAFVMMKEQHRPEETQTKSGLKKKTSGKVDFSLNVIQFVQQDAEADERSAGNFSQLTHVCKGQYQTVAGLDEIKSYVK